MHLPEGDFITNLVRLRVSYSFTTRVFVQALVQYNDRADLWSMNFRFGWLQAANTGLFIVYNDTAVPLRPRPRARADRPVAGDQVQPDVRRPEVGAAGLSAPGTYRVPAPVTGPNLKCSVAEYAPVRPFTRFIWLSGP